MNFTIDFNCDLGEDETPEGEQREAAILPSVTSINVACGYHAGSAKHMRRTMAAAAARAIAIGAHPSLPDREHFGRRELQVSAEDVYDDMLYQIGAAEAIARSVGAKLNHVKPHGALYNMAARDRRLADAIARAIRDFDPGLVLFGLSGSRLLEAGSALGLSCANEVFADRTYQSDATLTPRSRPDALIRDPEIAVMQVMRMLREQVVATVDGREIPIIAETVCIHGDSPNAPLFAARLRSALESAGIAIRPIIRGN